jgi:hypothetical protein
MCQRNETKNRKAVEMAEWWKPWKTKQRFSTVPTTPWKSGKQRRIPTFPQPRQLVLFFRTEERKPRAPTERSPRIPSSQRNKLATCEISPSRIILGLEYAVSPTGIA